MYSDLQEAIRAKLETDLELTVLKENQPDTPDQVKDALNSSGVVVIVGVPRQKPVSKRTVEVSVPIVVTENSEINFSTSGANQSPSDVVASATFALLQYQSKPFWTPMNPLPFEQLPPEDGLVGWGLMATTRTILPI